MNEIQIMELLGSPGLAVGHDEEVISQMMSPDRVKIRCATKERAQSLMYLARKQGIDAFSRGAILTVCATYWMGGIVEKLEILAKGAI